MRTKFFIKGKKGQQLNQREAKLINDSILNGLLLFHVELKNGRIVLYYNTEGLIPLLDFLRMSEVNKRLFLIIMRNIVAIMKGVEENCFSKNLIMWSLETAYVDPSTWHLYLMYVPLQPFEIGGNLKTFLLDVVSACTFEIDENTDYVQTLVKEINSGVSYSTYMLEDYCDRISDELVRSNFQMQEQILCPSCNSKLMSDESVCPFCGNKIRNGYSMRKPISQLHGSNEEVVSNQHSGVNESRNTEKPLSEQSDVSVNEDENGIITVFRKSQNTGKNVWLEDREHVGKIQITKFPFRIGKMEGVADYRIYSNTVSRKHADIIKEQGKYYIVDLGSTNGTFLNGKKIQPGVKEEIIDGTFLKLADTAFKFHVD